MLQTCMGKAFGAFAGFRWPIFATRLMLFRVITLKVLEITVPKFIDFGRWTIFDTCLMLLGVLTLETLENIMPNRRQYSGVNFREKKYAFRVRLVNIYSLDGHILVDVWQKLFTPLVRWKSMLPAREIWAFEIWMAFLLQTCDKSWELPFKHF